MKSRLSRLTSAKNLSLVTVAVVGMAAPLRAAPDAKTGETAGKPKEFDNPNQAAQSLVAAAEKFDVGELKEILGPDAQDIVSSEDEAGDKQRAMAFAAKAKEKMNVGASAGVNPSLAVVTVGNDNFELPIPLVKQKGKWVFDTKTGREEILNRRIGANELDAIAVCRGFVEAQEEYAQTKHDDSKVNQYAQRIFSTPGKQDGLAWQKADGTWDGPVGENVAKAIEEGYSKGEPYHGYFFKVLTKQGPAAPMGQMDFVVEGAMIGGFALAAAPAQYGVTGVESFMVGANGVVYQKDLGPETEKAFKEMDTFNSDKSWQTTDDQWPEEDEEDGAQQASSQ